MRGSKKTSCDGLAHKKRPRMAHSKTIRYLRSHPSKTVGLTHTALLHQGDSFKFIDYKTLGIVNAFKQ